MRTPYTPSVCGVGFVGEGPCAVTINGRMTPQYSLWKDMLRRCYSAAYHARHPTYTTCSVDDRWHNFQTFCRDTMRMRNAYVEGFELDKDLRVPGNRVYGPTTCSFVPKEINRLLNDHRSVSKGKRLQGVTVRKSGRVEVNMRVNSKPKHIGTFDNTQEAHEAYLSARTEYVRQTARKFRSELHRQVYSNLIKYQESAPWG